MEDIILANQQLNEWCGTEGINYYEGDTALGFLFKSAVPRLWVCEITLEEGLFWNVFVAYPTENGSAIGKALDEDPALALFWALYEVMK